MAMLETKYVPILEMVQPLVEQGVTEVPARFVQPEGQRVGASLQAAPGTYQIPVIDMSELDGDRRDQVLNQISSACEGIGFFQIINHGVPPAIMADFLDVIKEFFAMSPEEKEVNIMKPGKTVGYGRLFESKNSVANWIDRLVMWIHGDRQQQDEPCRPLKPERLRKVVDAYSSEVLKLCMRLVETLSVTLGLEPHVLGERLNAKDFGIRTSCNYYPPCPQPELVMGLFPHADSSIFTVLQQDGQVSGLEILNDGQWHQVPPLKDAFVVNVGDQLQIISNARYKSVMHRARTNTKEGRYSFPNFLFPPEETPIHPFPELLSESKPPLYRSITYGDYKNGFYFKAFANKRHLDNFLINNPPGQ